MRRAFDILQLVFYLGALALMLYVGLQLGATITTMNRSIEQGRLTHEQLLKEQDQLLRAQDQQLRDHERIMERLQRRP
jgi:hypothetical protein